MSLIQSDDDISSEEINTEGLGQGSSNPNATHDNPFFIAEEWIQDNSVSCMFPLGTPKGHYSE